MEACIEGAQSCETRTHCQGQSPLMGLLSGLWEGEASIAVATTGYWGCQKYGTFTEESGRH